MGDVMIVMLDSGEDKKDSHWAYSGLTDYDAYRSEQARWLEQLVKTKEYRKARYRIVICHFPMVMTQDQKDEGVARLARCHRQVPAHPEPGRC